MAATCGVADLILTLRKDFESKKAVQSISLMNKLNQSMKTISFKLFAAGLFFATAIIPLGQQTNTQAVLTQYRSHECGHHTGG